MLTLDIWHFVVTVICLISLKSYKRWLHDRPEARWQFAGYRSDFDRLPSRVFESFIEVLVLRKSFLQILNFKVLIAGCFGAKFSIDRMNCQIHFLKNVHALPFPFFFNRTYMYPGFSWILIFLFISSFSWMETDKLFKTFTLKRTKISQKCQFR